MMRNNEWNIKKKDKKWSMKKNQIKSEKWKVKKNMKGEKWKVKNKKWVIKYEIWKQMKIKR